MNWPWHKKKRSTYQPNRFHTIKKLEIFDMFLDLWPKLSSHSVYLSKDMYIMPSRKKVEQMLVVSDVDKMFYTADKQSSGNSGILICGDYALLLHSDVIRARYENAQKGKIPAEEMYSLAFGQIWFQHPVHGPHAVNLVVTHDEGILFALPQIDELRKAEKGLTVDFVRM